MQHRKETTLHGGVRPAYPARILSVPLLIFFLSTYEAVRPDHNNRAACQEERHGKPRTGRGIAA